MRNRAGAARYDASRGPLTYLGLHRLYVKRKGRIGESMRGIALTATVALSSCLMGCSGSSDGDAAAVSTPTATVTVTETVSSEATPSASATPTSIAPNVGPNALEVGQWREGSEVRSLVSALRQPSEVTPPSYLQGESGAEGALLQVKACVRKSAAKPAPISTYDFYLYGRAGGEYTVGGSTWDEWPPVPQFPYETKVAPGRCVAGWELYPMPKQTRIVRVSFGSGADAVAEWLAPKS